MLPTVNKFFKNVELTKKRTPAKTGSIVAPTTMGLGKPRHTSPDHSRPKVPGGLLVNSVAKGLRFTALKRATIQSNKNLVTKTFNSTKAAYYFRRRLLKKICGRWGRIQLTLPLLQSNRCVAIRNVLRSLRLRTGRVRFMLRGKVSKGTQHLLLHRRVKQASCSTRGSTARRAVLRRYSLVFSPRKACFSHISRELNVQQLKSLAQRIAVCRRQIENLSQNQPWQKARREAKERKLRGLTVVRSLRVYQKKKQGSFKLHAVRRSVRHLAVRRGSIRLSWNQALRSYWPVFYNPGLARKIARTATRFLRFTALRSTSARVLRQQTYLRCVTAGLILARLRTTQRLLRRFHQRSAFIYPKILFTRRLGYTLSVTVGTPKQKSLLAKTLGALRGRRCSWMLIPLYQRRNYRPLWQRTLVWRRAPLWWRRRKLRKVIANRKHKAKKVRRRRKKAIKAFRRANHRGWFGRRRVKKLRLALQASLRLKSRRVAYEKYRYHTALWWLEKQRKFAARAEMHKHTPRRPRISCSASAKSKSKHLAKLSVFRYKSLNLLTAGSVLNRKRYFFKQATFYACQRTRLIWIPRKRCYQRARLRRILRGRRPRKTKRRRQVQNCLNTLTSANRLFYSRVRAFKQLAPRQITLKPLSVEVIKGDRPVLPVMLLPWLKVQKLPSDGIGGRQHLSGKIYSAEYKRIMYHLRNSLQRTVQRKSRHTKQRSHVKKRKSHKAPRANFKKIQA